MSTPLPRTAAFTILELSIVMTILGLIVGGILAGKTLIRASELHAIVVQHRQIAQAVTVFKDKYQGLPGDLANATETWGAQAPPATCRTSVSTTVATCDGNGNGRIEPGTLPTESMENFRFWQHLANAGLIEGTYPGFNAGGLVEAGTAPAGKISSSVWGVGYIGSFTATTGQYFNGEYGNVFYFGGVHGSDGTHTL